EEPAVLRIDRVVVDPPAKVAVVDRVVIRVHFAGTLRVVGRAEVRAIHPGVRTVLARVLVERLRWAVVEAVDRVGCQRLNCHGREPLLDEMHVEAAAGRRHVLIAVPEPRLRRAVSRGPVPVQAPTAPGARPHPYARAPSRASLSCGTRPSRWIGRQGTTWDTRSVRTTARGIRLRPTEDSRDAGCPDRRCS